MNRSTLRRMQLRDVAQRVTHARHAVARQIVDRESVVRRDGAAHPRSIRASRRLNRTQAAYRGLVATYRRYARDAAREGQ